MLLKICNPRYAALSVTQTECYPPQSQDKVNMILATKKCYILCEARLQEILKDHNGTASPEHSMFDPNWFDLVTVNGF